MQSALAAGMLAARLCVLATLVATACASSSPPDDPMPDAAQGDPDPDPPDPAAGCAVGTHMCGDTCMPDNTNQVALGCRFGCGEPCPEGAHGTASCTALGTCGFDCEAGYTNVNGVCTVLSCSDLGYLCGDAFDDAGNAISCGTCANGASCTSGHVCDVADDAMEPNQTAAAARDLGTFDDADDAGRTVAGLNIAENMDEDWFKFRVIDGFDAGNPHVHVGLSLNSGVLAANHELTVWFRCDAGDAGTQISCGEAGTAYATNNSGDATLGTGCSVNAKNIVWAEFTASCNGTDDNGTVYARVRKLAAPRGDNYDIYVEAK
jgi:hypothetical protein